MSSADVPRGSGVTPWFRRLLGPSGANLAMQVCALGLALGTQALLSRTLGAAGLGLYAYAFAIANVVGVLARLGFEQLIVREVAISVERARWGLVAGLVRFTGRLSFGSSLVWGALVAVGGVLLTDPDTAAALVAVLPLLVVTSSAALRSAALRGLGAVVSAQVGPLVLRPVVFAALVATMSTLSIRSPSIAVLAHTAGLATAWAFGVVMWRRRRPTEIAETPPEYEVRRWMGSASSLVAIGLLGVLNTQADVVLLKGLASDASTGIYSVAAQLARTTSIVLTVANGVFAQRFAALHARGDREALQRLVGRSAAGVTAATLPAAAALALAGPWVLALFSQEFVAGYSALLVLVGAHVVNAAAGSVGNLLVMTGHEREVGRVTLGTVALNVALNLLLVPRLDVLGAAIGSGVAVITWNLVLIWRVRRLLGIDSTAVAWLRSAHADLRARLRRPGSEG